MTLGEFKYWLEGFSEGWDGKAPNAEQWAKVQERLETVVMFNEIIQNPIVPTIWKEIQYVPPTVTLTQ